MKQVVSAQRRAFTEHDDIRAEEAALQRQTLHQQEQLQQLHGAETGQLANEHAELLARASHLEAAAEAFAQRQVLDAQCVATAVEQHCERLVSTTRDELEASQLAQADPSSFSAAEVLGESHRHTCYRRVS